MNERSNTKTTDSHPQETTGSFEKFEKPYWGDTPKLTPEEIVEWLEGHREMMMLVKKSASLS
jgi:hypothetical protein